MEPSDPRASYHDAVVRHARDACSFQGLGAAFRYAFAPTTGAALAYTLLPRAWMGVGSPLTAPALRDQAALELAAQASAEARRALLFFGVEDPWPSERFRFLPLGEQPNLHPTRFCEGAARSGSLRAQTRRAYNKGLRVRDVAPSTSQARSTDLDALRALHRQWLSTRRFPPLGFLLAFECPARDDGRVLLLAEREGVVVGALSAVPVPARAGFFVEHLFLDPAAPNGTSESLLLEAALRFRELGASWFTLGLVPFSGSVPRWLQLCGTLLRPVYRADTLRAFRERLHPDSWSPVYVGYQEQRHILFVCRALYRAVRPPNRRALALGVLRALTQPPSSRPPA